MANQNPERQDEQEYGIYIPGQLARSNTLEIPAKIFLYNGLLLLTALSNIYILDPSMRHIFPVLTAQVSLIYLPFTIKLLVGFFEGFRAPFYLLPGAMFIDMYFYDGAFSKHKRIIAEFACYSLPPLAFAVTDWLMMSDRRVNFAHPSTWRSLFVAGFMASISCALLKYSTVTIDFSLHQGIKIMISRVIGDLAGLTAMLLLGMVLLKIYTRWQRS